MNADARADARTGQAPPRPISVREASERIRTEGAELSDLLAEAGRVRERFFGKTVRFCSVLNARCGGCSEDCAFCAQSAHSKAVVERFPLVSEERMLEAARQAVAHRAHRFGIVTSGRAVSRAKELDRVAAAVEAIARTLPVRPCASLGILSRDALLRLRDAGLSRYHHNLEAAPSFFGRICTSRTYEDSIGTVAAAKASGLSTCCCGIFGMGESLDQRVELLDTVRGLDVDSVPLNFLHPIPGTRLEGLSELTPLDCLKVIAVARLMMPDREIRVCGGREYNLRDLQSWVFGAGADGIMVGGYLTTSGRKVSDDLQLVADCGFEVEDGVHGSPG